MPPKKKREEEEKESAASKAYKKRKQQREIIQRQFLFSKGACLGFVDIPELQRECLFHFAENAIVSSLIDYIVDQTHCNGFIFKYGCDTVTITQEFSAVLLEYWMPNSKLAHKHIIVQGFFVRVPMTLPDGTVYWKVLDHDTYKVKMFYDITQEKRIYAVFRLQSDFINQTSTLMEYMRSQVRIDVGTGIDALYKYDEAAEVIDGFGFDPRMNGYLQSIISSLFVEGARLSVQIDLYLMQQRKIAYAKDYLQRQKSNYEFAKNIIDNAMPPEVQQFALEDTISTMNGAIQKSEFEVDTAFALYAINNNITADEPAYNYVKSFIDEQDELKTAMSEATNACNVANVPFIPTTPGGTVAPNKPPSDSKHLPFAYEFFRQLCLLKFHLPAGLIEQTGKAQANTDFQAKMIDSTIGSHQRIISLVLTRFYNEIYGIDDATWYNQQYVSRWLSDIAIQERKALLEQKRQTKPMPITMHEAMSKISDPSRLEQHIDDRSNLIQPRKKKKEGESEKDDQTDDLDNQLATINEIIDALYMASEEETMPIFEKLNKSKLIREETKTSLKNISSISSKQKHVIITFARTTPLTAAQLILFNRLGAIDNDETKLAMRSMAGLSNMDFCPYKGILDTAGDAISADLMNQLLQDTPLGNVFNLTHKQIVQNEQSAVSSAEEKLEKKHVKDMLKQKEEYEIKLKLLKLELKNQAQKQAQSASGGAKKSSSKSSAGGDAKAKSSSSAQKTAPKMKQVDGEEKKETKDKDTGDKNATKEAEKKERDETKEKNTESNSGRKKNTSKEGTNIPKEKK